MQARSVPTVVTQFAEDAAFLWTLRGVATGEPHFTLAMLAELDNRLDVHLDGLRVAGGPGWETARAALLDVGEAGEVFAASVLAFEGGDAGRVREVLAAGSAGPEPSRGLVGALAWLGPEPAARQIKPLLGSADPVLRRVGIAASVAQRRNPGAALTDAFASDHPALKARALRAVGELGLTALQVPTRANLKASDPACRFWAAWSSALLNGHRDALAHLQVVAEAGGPFAERAAGMAMRRLPGRDARVWLKRLVKDLKRTRTAVASSGAFGDPEVIPFLIDQMKAPAMARVAGESFSLITGADLAADKLAGPKPAGFESGPNDDPRDGNVALDPDENLPWPDPALVQTWWAARRDGFAAGTRYLLGQPVSPESARDALKSGRQRQRASAALELAILDPGRPLFDVRAPGFRQRPLLSAGP